MRLTLGAPIFLAVWDLFVYLVAGGRATITTVIQDASFRSWVVPLLIGLAVGWLSWHLWGIDPAHRGNFARFLIGLAVGWLSWHLWGV